MKRGWINPFTILVLVPELAGCARLLQARCLFSSLANLQKRPRRHWGASAAAIPMVQLKGPQAERELSHFLSSHGDKFRVRSEDIGRIIEGFDHKQAEGQ